MSAPSFTFCASCAAAGQHRRTAASAAMTAELFHFSPASVRQQREGPHRAALGHLVLELLARDVPVKATDPGEHGDVLPAALRESDRHGVDARAGLELPQLVSG